jgi:hypothetical protein
MRRFGLSLGSPSRAKSGVADQMRLVRRLHFYDYRNNVKAYPTWQKWLRENQPPLLVLWGKYDPHHTSTIVIGTCLTSMSFGGLPGVNSPSTSFGGVAKVTGRQRTKWVCFRSRMSAFVAVVTPLEPAGMGCAPIIVEFLKLLSLISRRK